MKKGEKIIFLTIAVMFVGSIAYNVLKPKSKELGDQEVPFYSTASPSLRSEAGALIKKLDCRNCHSLWTMRSIMQSVPAPRLDGIGSLKDEQWFFDYFSAQDPQLIIPSRLKREYQMPSYAYLSEDERRTLAAYMSSLKVKDWYLEETRKSEQEKLTGQTPPES